MVTLNPRRDIHAPGIVVVDGERIAHVGPARNVALREGDQVVDCRDLLLMPGLINTHTHACMALFRGLGADRPRRAWAPAYTLAAQARATEEDYYWGAVLGGLEMLANGITCAADRFSHMAVIGQAFEQIGMRAVLCHTVRDLDGPLEWDQATALVRQWGTDPEHRVHSGIGPHAPDTCSDDLLRRVRDFAGESGARIYIHCAQSEVEVGAVRARGYAGSVHLLAETGALGPDAVLAHCLYLNDDEIATLADSGAWVAHCPVSNARIEARVAPIVAMLRRGVNVALGTDWAPTNDTMDLFDEMKAAGLLHKVAVDNPEVMPVDRLLAMGTIDAARALGLGDVVGSLEVGKRADIIALDMRGVHLQPWRHIPATLVYAVKGQDVRHVWVDGRQVIRDRLNVAVDAADAVSQAARIWRRLDSDEP